MALNPIVQVGAGAGAVRFGAALPLALIAGPCQLESRAHALEMAGALKEIATRRAIGLLFKTSFDKANRTSGAGARGVGLKAGAADLRRNPRDARPSRAHRRARAGAMRCCRRGGRRAADPGVPLPPDRPHRRRGANGAGGQRQEGAVPRAVGHEARGGETRPGRRRGRAGHRARRQLRLQYARRRHALAADHGARDRRAGRLRRHPFGAAAGRAGRVLGRRA